MKTIPVDKLKEAMLHKLKDEIVTEEDMKELNAWIDSLVVECEPVETGAIAGVWFANEDDCGDNFCKIEHCRECEGTDFNGESNGYACDGREEYIEKNYNSIISENPDAAIAELASMTTEIEQLKKDKKMLIDNVQWLNHGSLCLTCGYENGDCISEPKEDKEGHIIECDTYVKRESDDERWMED